MSFMKERGFGKIDGTLRRETGDGRRETGGRQSAESKEQSEKRKTKTGDWRQENGESKGFINVAMKSRLL